MISLLMTRLSTPTNLPEKPDDNNTEQEAAYWFAVMLDQSVPAELRQEFERWHKVPVHAAAYQRLTSLWHDSALALQAAPLRNIKQQPVPAATSHRWYQQRRWHITAAAASVLFAVVLWIQPPSADYYTVAGQVQTVTLPDGSVAVLSPDTRLKLQFTGSERRLELLRGEAWFQVAPDRQRPFTVEAENGKSTALGTAFSVSQQQSGAEVIVTEHSVAVAVAAQQEVLQAGQGVRYHNKQLSAPFDVDTDVRLAWLNHQLVFLAQPLGSVIEELNRWHAGRLILLDDELAEQPVTLILDTRQGDAMLQNLIQGLSLNSFSVGSRVTFLYRK